MLGQKSSSSSLKMQVVQDLDPQVRCYNQIRGVSLYLFLYPSFSLELLGGDRYGQDDWSSREILARKSRYERVSSRPAGRSRSVSHDSIQSSSQLYNQFCWCVCSFVSSPASDGKRQANLETPLDACAGPS